MIQRLDHLGQKNCSFSCPIVLGSLPHDKKALKPIKQKEPSSIFESSLSYKYLLQARARRDSVTHVYKANFLAKTSCARLPLFP